MIDENSMQVKRQVTSTFRYCSEGLVFDRRRLSARDGRRRTRGESEATPSNTPVARESRLCVEAPIAKTPPLAPIGHFWGIQRQRGRAARMTEGEGQTAAIDDAAAARPSPANSPRVAPILNPRSR